jgi:hypothetical protein
MNFTIFLQCMREDLELVDTIIKIQKEHLDKVFIHI